MGNKVSVQEIYLFIKKSKKNSESLIEEVAKARKIYNRKNNKQLAGENSKSPRKYFVLYREVDDIGMGSQIYIAIQQIERAIWLGRTPVIYRKYFDTSLGEYINQWEICFKPLADESLNKIMNYSNTVIWNSKHSLHIQNIDFWKISKLKRNKYNKLFNSWIRLNEEMSGIVQSLWESFFDENDRVVGVLARGTDYNKSVAFQHPKQPSSSEIICKVKEVMEKCNCNKIFLATEDSTIFQDIKNNFNENEIRFIEQDRFVKEEKKTINCQIREKKVDKKKLLKDYVAAIYLLARCNCLVTGNTSASQILPILNNKYEYMYRFNIGQYEEGDLNSIIR